MNLKKQIKALEETLDYVREEYEQGEQSHSWTPSDCPLCRINDKCPECIFWWALGDNCSGFAKDTGESNLKNIPLEEIAGFLKSFIISLTENLDEPQRPSL